MPSAVARVHPNIALVKYWGKRDTVLNLPAVPSISLTVAPYLTETEVHLDVAEDEVWFNGARASPSFAQRTLVFLDMLDSRRPPCRVVTTNNFPSAAGLASSSSAFAALTLAYHRAAGKTEDPFLLSVAARRGSGSACRSLWGGWVAWSRGDRADGLDSHGRPLWPDRHWDVRIVVALVSDQAKSVGSTEAMERSRRTSPYFDAWVRTAEADVAAAKQEIEARDLAALGPIVEASSFKMHATMHTASPPLLYWKPETVACLAAVKRLREEGLSAWATMDAGPNVKILCEAQQAEEVAHAVRREVPAVILHPGGDPIVEDLPS